MKNPERRDSLMVGAAASTAKGSKVTVKDMEQSIDIATGEGGDAEFFRSQ